MSEVRRVGAAFSVSLRTPLIPLADHERVVAELRAEVETLRVEVMGLTARAERAEARVAELEANARRLDYLESKVRHFGNGLTEPRETTLFFGWQQSQEQETFPGLRAAIDQQLAKGREG